MGVKSCRLPGIGSLFTCICHRCRPRSFEGFANIPNKLAESFDFKKGAIFDIGPEHAKEKILTANAFYESDRGQVILMVKKADPQEIVYPMSVELEKVKLRDSEAVHKVMESPSGAKLQQLTWVKGEDTLYSVQTADEEIAKSDLVSIADTLDQKQIGRPLCDAWKKGSSIFLIEFTKCPSADR